MKKSLIKGFSLLVLIFSINIMSCSNLGDAVSMDSESRNSYSDEYKLRVNMGAARTILPNDWTQETASKLKYVLTGNVVDNVSINISYNPASPTTNRIFTYDQIKPDAATPATVKIDAGTWKLVLTGYQTTNTGTEEDPVYIIDDTKPVLQGTINEIDLTSGNQFIDFYLQPVYKYSNDEVTGGITQDNNGESATVSAGEGTVDFSVTFNTTENLANVKYGIYSNKDGTDVVNVNGTSSENTTTKALLADDGVGKKKINISGSIKHGQYYFYARFYNASGTQIGYYSEDIKIDGGNKSVGNRAPGDVIAQPANNPTEFSVETSYENKVLSGDDPDTEEIETDNTYNNTYLAKFTWSDDSFNEDGFELIIFEEEASVTAFQAELDDTEDSKPAGIIYATDYNAMIEETIDDGEGNPISKYNPYLKIDADTALATGENINTTAKNMVAGDLKPFSTTCTVVLETGKKYVAFIRAYNHLDKLAEPNNNNDSAKNELKGINTFGIYTVCYNLAEPAQLTALKDIDGAKPFSIYINQEDISTKNTTGYVIGYEYDKLNTQLPLYVGKDADMTPRVVSETDQEFKYWYDTIGDPAEDCIRYHYTPVAGTPVLINIPAKQTTNIVVYGKWEATHRMAATFKSYTPAGEIQLSSALKPGDILTGVAPGDTVTLTTSTRVDNVKFKITNEEENTIYDGTVESPTPVAGITITNKGEGDPAASASKLDWNTTTCPVTAGRKYTVIISGDFTWEDNGVNHTERLTEHVYINFDN